MASDRSSTAVASKPRTMLLEVCKTCGNHARIKIGDDYDRCSRGIENFFCTKDAALTRVQVLTELGEREEGKGITLREATSLIQQISESSLSKSLTKSAIDFKIGKIRGITGRRKTECEIHLARFKAFCP